MIGIIGAMEIEVESLINHMRNRKSFVISGIKYTKGKFNGKECVVAKCNPGKVNAAICAQIMIFKFLPSYIINTGVAGAITDALSIGDIAVADNIVQHDIDTSPLGNPRGMILGINLIKIPCSRYLIENILAILNESEIKFSIGTILTGDQFINNREKLNYLSSNFSGIACEMEGGSIGQVCYVNNVDFIVIRSISDGADNNSEFDYKEFVKFSAKKSSCLVEKLLLRL